MPQSQISSDRSSITTGSKATFLSCFPIVFAPSEHPRPTGPPAIGYNLINKVKRS
jgi:hypothetical protein